VLVVAYCRMYELAIALQLLVVTICKRSINAIVNPNLVYSHTNAGYTHSDIGRTTSVRFMSHQVVEY
jgi:hypothetical protein